MTERKPANHSKSAPPGPAIKEPGKPPLPKEARKSTQQGGTQKNAAQQSAQGEFGEGNYKATREYNEGLKRHMETHDIEKEARDAAPRSKDEAEDMERAEEIGRSHAHDDRKDQNA
jgi:hypothetical protein